MLKKIILFIILLLDAVVVANAKEIYTVKAVKISASAKNSNLARNIAIEQGQIKAFNILINKYFVDAKDKVKTLDKETILNTIAGFELAEERSSSTHYMAKINVKFSKSDIDNLTSRLGSTSNYAAHPKKHDAALPQLMEQNLIPKPILNQTNEFQDEDAQRRLLGEHNPDPQNSFVSLKMGNGITTNAKLNHTNEMKLDTISKNKQTTSDTGIYKNELSTSPNLTILLVPIYEEADKTYWFEDDNHWLDVWQRKMLLSNLRNKFILPLGDLEDLKLLNKNILNKNITDLNNLFERYEVNAIALIQLGKIENTPLKRLTLQAHYISRFNPLWQQHNFADLTGENQSLLMTKAFEEITNFNFSKDRQLGNSFDITETHTIEINIALENMFDWIHFEDSLAGSKYIKDLVLKKMNLKECRYSLTYNISFLNLQLLLKKHNFNLQDQGNGQYSLTREIFPNV